MALTLCSCFWCKTTWLCPEENDTDQGLPGGESLKIPFVIKGKLDRQRRVHRVLTRGLVGMLYTARCDKIIRRSQSLLATLTRSGQCPVHAVPPRQPRRREKPCARSPLRLHLPTPRARLLVAYSISKPP